MKNSAEKHKLVTYDFVFETENFPLAVQLLDRKGSPGWHHHDGFYEIVLVVEGNSRHTCENQSYLLQAQEILVIPPGMHHNYGDEKFCYYNILVDFDSGKLPLFDIANTEGFQKLFVITPRTYLSSGGTVSRNFLETDDFLQAVILLKTMMELKKDHPSGWQFAMVGKFIELLRLFCHAVCGQERDGEHVDSSMNNIGKLAVNMAQNCAQKWPVSRMCKRCGMSRAGLFREFKKYYRTTPVQFLTRQRLRKACALLKETDKNLEMIAMESGFASGNYLGTIFKKSLHMTPLHYRREFQDGISRLPSVAALSGTAAEALDE
ncbi:MAG: helix-turn-helix domain-containing protein [Lentisphaeria bacterium]|nr:helix-turn-helix domain-containing protein [Lentisphaeria bacterium]